MLFYFRLKARCIYGLTESVVGVLIALNKVTSEVLQLNKSEFYLAILTASLFLIVRGGFDNMHVGLENDKFAKKFLALFGKN